jgi:hypothetical protein
MAVLTPRRFQALIAMTALIRFASSSSEEYQAASS